MLQENGLQWNFLRRLLALASRPATRSDGLLQFALEKALALTSSDTGGAIFVFDISTPEQAPVASALRGHFADTITNLLKTWKENPYGRSLASPAFVVLHSGKPYRIDDHLGNPAHFPLLAGGRSSLWVPLLEGSKVMGVIHVESSQPGYYKERHINQLQNLAAEMVPAINRLILKEKLVQVGAPMAIVGMTTPFLELERQIRLTAGQSLSPVLITGERGSGKELTAWAIHSLREDIPLLTSHFLRKYCQEIRRPVAFNDFCAACQNSEAVGCATTELYQALQNYHWPGNVRELEHLILRLLAFVPDEVLNVKHLHEHFPSVLTQAAKPETEDLTLDAAVRSHIERVLRLSHHNQSQAAKILGLPFSTLQSKMKKLGIKIK